MCLCLDGAYFLRSAAHTGMSLCLETLGIIFTAARALPRSPNGKLLYAVNGEWYNVIPLRKSPSLVTPTRCLYELANTRAIREVVHKMFFTCPSCNHQANHETERYWHPAIESIET